MGKASDGGAADRTRALEAETFETEFLPAVYRAAENASRDKQREYLRVSEARLGFAVVAAACVVIAETVRHVKPGFGLAAAVAFLLALASEIWLLAIRPEQSWYEARALAESLKSLCWVYAIGGPQFPVARAGDEATAETEFASAVEAAVIAADEVRLDYDVAKLVTGPMRELRAEQTEARRAVYVEHRVGPQYRWYAERAGRHECRRRGWAAMLISTEVIGAGLALAYGLGSLSPDYTGFVSVVLAAGSAWLAVNQHELLARSYGHARDRLGFAARTVLELDQASEDSIPPAGRRRPRVEADWRELVDKIERAIGEEHTMWRAARVVVLGTKEP